MPRCSHCPPNAKYLCEDRTTSRPHCRTATMHRSSSVCDPPNATLQQSRPDPSSGSSEATATSGCLGSHTRTVPSRLPVTNSGAPPPMLSPAAVDGVDDDIMRLHRVHRHFGAVEIPNREATVKVPSG